MMPDQSHGYGYLPFQFQNNTMTVEQSLYYSETGSAHNYGNSESAYSNFQQNTMSDQNRGYSSSTYPYDQHYYGYPPYYSYADWKDFYGYSNIMTLASSQGSVSAENQMQVPSFAFSSLLIGVKAKLGTFITSRCEQTTSPSFSLVTFYGFLHEP